MVLYPECPHCSNSSLSIVDVEINGYTLKGIQCNSCKKFCGFFQDINPQIEKMEERLEEMENNISDLDL